MPTEFEEKTLLVRAIVELGAALDAADLLPPDHPGIDWACAFLAVEQSGAFAHLRLQLPPPPQGAPKPPARPPDFTPDEIAARRKAAAAQRARRRPTWRRRRGPSVIDLTHVTDKEPGQ